MIDHNLIVPFRKHTLAECSVIIRKAYNPQGYTWTAPPVEDEQAKWRGWIDACLTEATKPLTDWEQQRLVEWSDRLTMTGHLTDGQVEVLERIYTAKV